MGTASTISKVSREGKEGFMGKISHKMKNVQRYFINTLGENFSQNSIDILLGKHSKSIVSSHLRKYLDVELKKRVDLYTEITALKVCVGTWNLGGIKPYETVDLAQWLYPFRGNFIPDIFVIGFQEIVELNASSILMGNNQPNVKMWTQHIQSNLSKLFDESYVHLAGEDLVGIYIAFFARKAIS